MDEGWFKNCEKTHNKVLDPHRLPFPVTPDILYHHT